MGIFYSGVFLTTVLDRCVIRRSKGYTDRLSKRHRREGKYYIDLGGFVNKRDDGW